MKQFRQYIYLETKRMLLLLPKVLLGSLLFLALLTGIFMFCQLYMEHSEQNPVLQIGVVAAKDEPFIDWLLTTAGSMENARYSCNFKRISHKDAAQKLQSGEIDAVFLIPKEYIASIINGKNKHITIRFGNSETNIKSFLFRQLCEAASSYILSSEAGIYTMQEYYLHHSLPQEIQDERELNLRYIQEIIDFNHAIKIESLQDTSSYPLSSRYLVSAFVLILLFWGLSCSTLLAPQKRAFQNQLYREHIGYGRQLMARSLAFLLISLLPYLLLFTLASFWMIYSNTALSDTICNDIPGLWQFALFCLPLLAVCSVLIQLIYELTEDTLGGILCLFLGTLLLGLCSGCFYPFEALPAFLQRLAPLLPIYPACRYGLAVLYHSFDQTACLSLAIWFIISWLLMLLCRKTRCRLAAQKGAFYA